MISIFNKELRDCLKWVPAGMVIALVMVWVSLPDRIDRSEGMETDLMGAIGWSAALIAFAFGLLQSLFDIRNDARGYLLHRPVRRSTIFWAKIASGVVAYVLALTPAVLVAVFYLNSRGLEWLPVSGMQVIPGLALAAAVALLHPVAMWIGNRDARWVGTRVLPLAGIATFLFCIFAAYEIGFSGGNATQRRLLYVLLCLFHIIAIVVVLVAARHAFCNRQMLPPASGRNSTSWSTFVGLTFSAIVVATVVFTFVIQSLNPIEANYTTRQVLMNRQGQFQQVQVERKRWNWDDATYSVRPAADSTVDFKPVDEQWQFPEYSAVNPPQQDRYSWFGQFSNMGSFGTGSTSRGPVQLFSHRGRLIAYERNHLAGIVSPNGVSRDGKMPQDQFQDLGVLTYLKSSLNSNGALGSNPLVLDASGIYQFDSDTFEMNRLNSESVSRVCMLFADNQTPATLWTISGGTLTQHSISAVDEKITINEATLTKNHRVSMPLIKIGSSKKYNIDLPAEGNSISVFRADDGQYGYVRYDFSTQEHFYGMLSDDGSVEKLGPITVPPVAYPNQDSLALGIAPVIAYGMAIWRCFSGLPVGVVSPWGIIGFAILQSLLAAVGTFALCKWLSLSNRHCWIWTVVALLGGWGICLAAVACHKRLVKEACPHCHKQTRVDLENCTQCGKSWLPPELDQIEIFDSVGKAA